MAESGGNDVIIPVPRDEAINWYINRGIREERRATTQELSVRCLSGAVLHHPPRYEGGYNVAPPLNEAHQLKTSSPLQWVRHQLRSTQFVPHAFFFLLFFSPLLEWITG